MINHSSESNPSIFPGYGEEGFSPIGQMTTAGSSARTVIDEQSMGNDFNLPEISSDSINKNLPDPVSNFSERKLDTLESKRKEMLNKMRQDRYWKRRANHGKVGFYLSLLADHFALGVYLAVFAFHTPITFIAFEILALTCGIFGLVYSIKGAKYFENRKYGIIGICLSSLCLLSFIGLMFISAKS